MAGSTKGRGLEGQDDREVTPPIITLEFPPGFKRNNNSVKQGFNANVDVKMNDKQSSASPSSGFTSEQMHKLLSLINDNTFGSIHVNMAGLEKEKVLDTCSKFGGLYLFNMNKDCSVGKSNMVAIFCFIRQTQDDSVFGQEDVQAPNFRRSSRPSKLPARFIDYVVSSNVKYGIKKFVSYANLKAMNNEIEDLNRNNTWYVCDLPYGRKAIGCKWIYKIKYKSFGEVERYKVRLVAKGFSQRESFDYDETFSPVIRMVTVRCLISIVVVNGWPLYQLDVNNVFLYGDLVEDVYMTLPEGDVFVALLMYVNDIVIIGNDETEISNFKRKYFLELLHEYGLLAVIPVDIPLPENTILSFDETKDDKYLSDFTIYQKLKDKLIYLTNTRPDICYAVHCLIQHTHSPLQSYFKSPLRVLRYLKGSPGCGIQFYKKSNLKLKAYADAD
ncbi:ribonuclease H-like domain-containing protein [Tanacetum coccineum]